MGRLAVYNAFRSRLAANLPAGLKIIEVNGEAETPADGSSFVTLQFPVTNERNASVGAPGNNRWRVEGVARIVISVPRGRGLGQMLTYADALAAAFRGKTFSDIETYEVDGPIFDDGSDDGNYFVASLVIVYRFDTFG